MRKLLVLLLTALFLGGMALAQDTDVDVDVDVDADADTMMMDDAATSQWVGVSTGFPLGIVLHYGIEDLIGQNIDLRANLDANFLGLGGSGVTISGGADALYHLPIDMDGAPFDVYAGGGINVGFQLGDDGGFSAGVRGIGGVEYLITNNIGVFAEARVGIGLNPIFRPALALGANYHF